jgi:hypothetical protein
VRAVFPKKNVQAQKKRVYKKKRKAKDMPSLFEDYIVLITSSFILFECFYQLSQKVGAYVQSFKNTTKHIQINWGIVCATRCATSPQ